MKKNVFILRSNSVNPDPRVEKIANFLQSDYSITIFAWDREKISTPKEHISPNCSIERFGPKSSFGTGFKGLLPLIVWQVQLFIKLLYNVKKIDIIHSCDLDTVIPSFLIRFFFKKKVVYDMFDHYAQCRNFSSKIEYLINKLENYFSHNADALILVDDIRKLQIKTLNKKTVVIYNSPNVALSQEPDIKQTNVISYVGVLQNDRFLLQMINAMNIKKNWTLNIAGFGFLLKKITDTIEGEKMPNVHFFGKVDYKKSIELNAASEVMVAIYDPSIKNNQLASPNKYFEGLALGKILIAAHNTHIDKEIQNENVGFVFEYGDIDSFIKILEIIENLSAIEKDSYSKRAKLLYKKKYSYEIQANSLLQLYNYICS